MQISAKCPYLIGPGEPVHQSVNSRNNSDASAGIKLWDAGFDGTVEEYGRCAIWSPLYWDENNRLCLPASCLSSFTPAGFATGDVIPLLTWRFLLGTQAIFLFSSSLTLSLLSFLSSQCDKPSEHPGCDFVLCTRNSFLTFGTSGLAYPDSMIGSLKVTRFTSFPLVANVDPAGFLSSEVGSETAHLRPSFFTRYTCLTTSIFFAGPQTNYFWLSRSFTYGCWTNDDPLGAA